jgi:outer membrane protein TolC
VAVRINGARDIALAKMSRWQITPDIRLPDQLPESLQSAPDKTPDSHPEMEIAQAQAAIAETAVSLAKQQYKPSWAIEAGYGVRDERTDLASIGVSMTLPLFTHKRQDPELAAAQQQYQGAREAERNVRTDIFVRVASARATLASVQEQISRYEESILPQLKNLRLLVQAEYRTAKSGFEMVSRTEDEWLQAQRSLLELKVQRAQAIIELRYFLEEIPA